MDFFLRIGKFPSEFEDHISFRRDRLNNLIGFIFHGMQMQL
jgi:hypothetical protein